MNYKYVPIDRIFNKVISDITDDFDEGKVIDWTGEALEFIGAVRYYEEAVAFIEVKNHQFELPKWLHNVIQIARDNQWSPHNKALCTSVDTVIKGAVCQSPSKEKISWSDGTVAPICTGLQWSEEYSEYILLDCEGRPTTDYELAYYRPYFDLKFEYQQWCGSSLYSSRYTPVRLSTSNLYDSLVCRPRHDSPCGDDSYTIIKGTTVRTSFCDGMVAVSYNRQVVEEGTGYPMIPDNISYTTAIISYIRKMLLGRNEFGSPAWRMAGDEWQWYCKQASNLELMPSGVDEYQNLLDQRQYFLPNHNRYYSFFGRISTPEVRKYNQR